MKTLDEIRREMISAGMPSEHAAQAVGAMADYGMAAYRQGYSRGFNEGVNWQIERNTRAKVGSKNAGNQGQLPRKGADE